MSAADWKYLMWTRDPAPLSPKEIEEGWHFCVEWDGLLIGPGMEAEMESCCCHE
jgi:hypothetical protein